MPTLPSRSLRLSLRLYQVLLQAYPPVYRQAYGSYMRQLFADLCRDVAAPHGLPGLLRLWLLIVPDLAKSCSIAYLEAAREDLMRLSQTITPVPWRNVALVIVPGILFGISRVVSPLGWLAGAGFVLVALLAAALLLRQRPLPIWSLLVLGLLTSWALQLFSYGLPGLLIRSLTRLDFPALHAWGNSLLFSPESQQMVAAIPIWLAIFWLLWKYYPAWHSARWIILLIGLSIAAAIILIDTLILLSTGLVLLPAAIGLALSRRFGSLASLFVLGACSQQVLFDSDYYSGSLVINQPFYALYVLLVIWLLVTIAPLLLLRAQTLPGQAAGLLAPALAWGAARIIVPWLVSPDFHPVSTWLGEALLSTGIVLVLALTFYLSVQAGNQFKQRQGSTI